ncbi:MAG: hypothetical protein JXA69_04420 [Phycisphaerae bacterium]|nr:hypothetical protein [Phycisphaerae bacterium]
MTIQAALKGQYHAALAMLKQTIEQCPEDLWAGGENAVAFWRVAYHALFFTHLYLQSDMDSFRPWEHHRDEYECLGVLPYPPHHEPRIGEAYTKPQLLEYWQVCDTTVDTGVDELDLDAQDCGFPWYAMNKLEHQINNIRHIQHHAALLAGRLRLAQGIDVSWAGSA